MLVKGAVIKPTPRFVKERYGAYYETWRAQLTVETRTVVDQGIVSSWYPIERAMIEPTRVLCELVEEPADEVAWALGRFSADFALRGLFRIFVRLGSPAFIAKRASHLFSTYYDNAVLRVHSTGPRHATLYLLEFPEPNRLVERRIGGYMERAVEISGARYVQSTVVSSLAAGDERGEYHFTWR
jgi:hypothetical protein